MMAEVDVSLSPEQMDLFVDLWESNECLWNPADKDYKNKCVRSTAMASIAETFGRGWTIDQVKRKLESLKSYYRTQKRKKVIATTTGSAGGKRAWPVFDRINAFLGTVQYTGSTVTASDIADDSASQLTNDISATEEDDILSTASPSGSGSSDIDLLTQRVTHSSSGKCARQDITSLPEMLGDIGGLTSPPLKKRVLGKVSSSGAKKTVPNKPDFQEVAVGFIQQLKESRIKAEIKAENHHMNYAVTVAERMGQINSVRRLTILKHKIDNLLHEALMEEMPDD